MNRVLPYLNLVGMLLLTGVCVLQWGENRHIHRESSTLAQAHRDQTAKLDEQTRTLTGLSADLDRFRERLRSANDVAKESESRLRPLEQQVQHLTQERDHCKSNVTTWTEAVAARDERLKAMSEQLLSLATERQAAVIKFNELAEKYNAVVKDLNEAHAQVAIPQTQRPSAGTAQ